MTAPDTPGPATGWPWAEHFDAAMPYFGTATAGLPPRETSEAMTAVLDQWRTGRIDGPGFDPAVTRARESYARLVGVDAGAVAIGHQVSPLVGLIASSVPDGAEVLVPEGEFTSVTFPFAAHEARGVRIVEAPLSNLAEHVTERTAIVAVAAVQSADGAVVDLDAIEASARAHGVDVLVDLTQAAGWLEVDASRFAYTVCGTYKWLLSPRGTAFLTVRPDRWETLVPEHANWYAGESPWESIYGLPLRLARDARRFDVSPGWFSWVGTAASLDFLERVGVAELQQHARAVEAAFAHAAGLPPGTSAIRSLEADDAVAGLMAEAGAVASVRAGRLRLSFHVNNTIQEAEQLGRLLAGHVAD
ncbi:class V aminotransferase [Knoellia sinensis KCTC 19936]|uniref:Class V aminotransferase n=1 Tax=Knoellia sinensis KCTC 19936 TaxID=1385520 RepID=A0A0A0J9N2_9MICO|nr:aminotransferase class V-fold PLP-dependent enzyme [Knoellia sinensis]KGN33848.1 class V aminotransferase [Knoellia sinensis KCTC 19936]